MNDYEQTKRLASLTQMVLAAEQTRMAILRRQEANLRKSLSDLTIDRAIGVAQQAGADTLYQAWADSRRRSINIDLARNLAEQDGHRATLARAFGRDQVCQELVERTKPRR
jgi:2-methylisocitrate lyase-like PEP mutase family enzyme